MGEGHKKVPSLPLKSYVDQIRKTATSFGFPILDLYDEPALDPHDQFIHEHRMPDGLHPNSAGHEMIANKIVEFLREYQR